MIEIVPLKDFPNYGITRDGRVYSYITNRFLKTPCNKAGYSEVNLYLQRVPHLKTIHRLVAETFLPNPFNKREVNHKNGIKTDNRIENLEWVTPSENIRHALETGLNTCNMKVVMCSPNGEVIRIFRSQGEASIHGFDQRLISRAIKNGFKHKGYFWKEVVENENDS